MTLTLPLHSRAPRSPERMRFRDREITTAQPLLLPAAPRARRAVWGKAATPRAPFAHSRALLEVPGDFTLVKSPAAAGLTANHPASFRNSRSMNPLSNRWLAAATEKHCTLVQKLWRRSLPCGNERKSGNERKIQASQTLHSGAASRVGQILQFLSFTIPGHPRPGFLL
jgi:hypothetical protein